MTTVTDRYLVFIWSDVEPELFGPFNSAEERNYRALQLRAEEGPDHGIFTLDIMNGMPEISSYPGHFFEEDGG